MPTGEAASDVEVPTQWTRGSLVVLLLIAATALVLGWLSREASLTVYGDDPIYLTLSRSLATGHYRDEFLVGAPPHAQYPPGMPAWLLLVRTVAGSSLDAALGANLLLLLGCALLLADAVRRLSTTWLGVVAAAILLFNPAIFALAGQLRSEIPFMAICSLALWISLVDDEAAPRWYPALAIAACLAAFLTRSAGIALVPAIGWALLVRRRWSAVVAGGLVSLTVVVGWFAYTRWAGQHTIGHTYAADLASNAPMNEPVRFLGHAFVNAKTYFSLFAATQFGIPDIHDQPLDNLVVGLLLAIPIMVGAWALRRRWPAMGMFLLLSTMVLLVFSWPVTRLLTALLPWLIAAMLIGWFTITSSTRVPSRTWFALAVGVVLAGTGLVRRIEAAELLQGCRATAPFVDPRCYQEQDRNYVAAARFIRDRLPTSAVIAASKPAAIYAFTERQTLPLELFMQTSASKLLTPNGPATHILLSRLIPFEAEDVGPRLRDRCAALSVLAEFPSGTLVLAPQAAPGATSPNACTAIARYLRETPVVRDD